MYKNNDIFIEELVRRQRGAQESLIKVGAVVIAILLLFVVFMLTRIFFPFFLAVICILLFFVFKYTVKEYEYSFISGELDIDVIWGMRKRKRIFSTSCRDIKLMAPYKGKESVPADNYSETLDATISKSSPDRWYFICQMDDGVTMLVLFNPSKRLRDAFKTYLGDRMKDA